MRDKKIKKKITVPDPLYGSRPLTCLINNVMRNGKKRLAENIVYRALEIIKKTENPIKTFDLAIATIGPKMEVKTRRVGGASYQVPMEVRGERRVDLAMRWLVQYAHRRSNKEFKTFAAKLAAEIIDASRGQGEAIKKRDTVHRMAEANKAFAHFKW